MNSPRVFQKFSPSTSNLELGNRVYQDRKQRAHNIRKKLHEKLSLVDPTSPSEKSDFSEIGDGYGVAQKSIGDRFQIHHVNDVYGGSTSGEWSADFEKDFESSTCRIDARQNNKTGNRAGNISGASKSANVLDRKNVGNNKFSSQSFCSRGLTCSVFEKKFRIVAEKSLQSINEIRLTISKGISPPDGDEDESRRAVRVKEFSNRFSRNYLYPLARQLKELTPPHQMNPLIVNQKTLSAYQTILHGIQAYQSHLPASMGDSSSFNQLKILMGSVIELCGIHRVQIKEEEEDYIAEFIDTLKINSELTIQKVEDYLSKPPPSLDNFLKSDNTQISLAKYGQNNDGLSTSNKKSSGKTTGKKGSLDKRLSMYTVTASFRKDAPWKRAVESLAKKKFNVKSKYKTATYKHRPPIQKDPRAISVSKLKTLFPRKSGELRVTRLNSPLNEDRIKTMVEMEGNCDIHLEKEDREKMEKRGREVRKETRTDKEEILIKLLQYALKNHQPEGNVNNDQLNISEILNLVKKESNVDFLKKVLDGLTNNAADGTNKENDQQLTLQVAKSLCSMSDGGGDGSAGRSRRKEPKITVTGEKNAKLICITDDNSVIEPPQIEEDAEDKVCQTDDLDPCQVIIRTCSETQTDINTNQNNIKLTTKGTQKGKGAAAVKISRLKKSQRNLGPLEKTYAVNVIQYKLDFYRHCKTNPMYRKSTTCQPWVLMGNVTEEILNQSLLAVAREIEVNDVVERVFRSELQF